MAYRTPKGGVVRMYLGCSVIVLKEFVFEDNLMYLVDDNDHYFNHIDVL